ncbi:MAG: VCBS repeat-containing protein [Deltaproteobacteria bacterium]|nr:VCBS repeat-containing protein [Deltaproteobacteria bacterium]
MLRPALALLLGLSLVACFPDPPGDDEDDTLDASLGDAIGDATDTRADTAADTTAPLDVDPNAPPQILAYEPLPNESAVPVTDRVEIVFDHPMAVPTGDEVVAWSAAAGRIAGTFSDEAPTRIIFEPDLAFVAGDRVDVAVRKIVASTAGEFLEAPVAYHFWTAVKPGQGKLVAGPSVAFTPGTRVLTGLIDGDRFPDVITTGVPSFGVDLLLAKAGALAEPVAVGAGRALDAVLADLDNDGDLDLAVATEGNVQIVLGNGDGTFAAARSAPATSVTLIASGDLDADGDLDLVAVESETAVVLLNQGDGTFSRGATTPAGPAASGMVVADLNADGRLDIAIVSNECCSGGGSLHVALAKGEGGAPAFTDASYTIGQGAMALVVGDFDLDEALDLAVANAADSNVGVLLNRGNGAFDPQEVYGAGTAISGLAAGDLDGDGQLDLVGGSVNDVGIVVLANRGNGVFSSAITVPGTAGARHVALVDADRDGDLDVVAETGAGVLLVRNEAASN